jgi:hypothetical protein
MGEQQTVNPEARHHFFQLGLQYYVAGRAAVALRQDRVAGSILHHAVEMLLKAPLSTTRSLPELKKLGHGLVAIWQAFKDQLAATELTQFDQLIASLDRFEKIRYPDEVLKHGMGLAIGFGANDAAVKYRDSDYVLFVGGVDDLVAQLFEITQQNPLFYWSGLQPDAARFLQLHNAHYDRWFGKGE